MEVFKSLNGLNPVFIAELLEQKFNQYSLRSGRQLILPPANTITFGTRALSFRGSLLWNRLPKYIKDSTSILQF